MKMQEILTYGKPSVKPSVIDNQCLKTFDLAVESLNKRYLDGMNRRLEANPSLAGQIDAAENEINAVWQLVIDNQATLQQFQQAVKAWYKLWLELFRSGSCRTLDGQVQGQHAA